MGRLPVLDDRAALACANRCPKEIILHPGFGGLPRVTSDARPFRARGLVGHCPDCGLIQKPPTTAWQAETDEIYTRYGMFRQARGG